MTSVSIVRQATRFSLAKKEKGKIGDGGLFDRLKRLFWGYTSKTGDSATKCYEGIL